MKAQGKPYGVILNNVNNKLVHILFSLVLHDCDFEPVSYTHLIPLSLRLEE